MILTVCDTEYLFEAAILIKSCARYEPLQPFYLFLINEHSTPDEEIEKWHPNISIERVQWIYNQECWRALMCCARSIPIDNILKTRNEKLIYLDSDTIVRGSLSELFKALDQYDLIVKYRPKLNLLGAAGTTFAAKFNSGVIGLRPTPIGKAFSQAYNHAIREFIASGKPLELQLGEHKIVSIIDQELLYTTYLDFKDEISFLPLPEKFNDSKFKLESIIWHGKGSAREHLLYIIERAKYQYPIFYNFLSGLQWMLMHLRNAKYRARHILKKGR